MNDFCWARISPTSRPVGPGAQRGRLGQGESRQASAADYASVELSLRAQLAEDYFNLRSYDAQQQLDQDRRDYRESLKLTPISSTAAPAALADVAQAQAQLDNALTQAADVKLQRDQAEHAIAVLVGENPSLFTLPANALPLDVVHRRRSIPDSPPRCSSAAPTWPKPSDASLRPTRRSASLVPPISQAHARASGRIGEHQTSNLFSAPSLFWSVGPQISVPIFEGGRLVARPSA
jgi:outer membrane protein TolC